MASIPEEQREGEGLAHRLKPAAPARAHLLMAALLWSAVGAMMLYRAHIHAVTLEPGVRFAAAGAALALGLFKGAKVLRPAAKKSVARIIERGDGKCLGGFISFKSWLFVALMVALGRVFARSGLPEWLAAAILGAVGVGLALGCMVFWAAWLKGPQSSK